MTNLIESPLKRQEHALTRALYPFFLSRSNTPFTYGQNDCAFFAADAILAMTGTDLLADFRGQYSDGPSALRAIKSITGGSSIADAVEWVTEKHGLNALPGPLYAQRGDLVLCNYKDGGEDVEFLGIVALDGTVAIPGAKGLTRLPLTAALKAWRI
jgi:hypothetical protein